MKNVKLLAERYQNIFKHRDPRLFTEFLVKGYNQTTLDSVPEGHKEDVVYAKVCLGMIITLYDDLADNPKFFNPKLLKHLYRLNVGDLQKAPLELSENENSIYSLALNLFIELENTIRRFENFSSLRDILAFDISQVFFANQYAELMTAYPQIRNLTESKLHGPYNMGMVAAGMIDLMATANFDMQELGSIREFLIQGQRMGRIGNLISTFEREKSENDMTSEILAQKGDTGAYKIGLQNELSTGLKDLAEKARRLKNSVMNKYVEGLRSLYQLHISMEGII